MEGTLSDRRADDFEGWDSFYDEIGFFPPVKYFPGVIGGHCVMPNIKILNKHSRSVLLEAIQASNELKTEREAQRQTEAEPVGKAGTAGI